jgi:hypothetical protein
MDSSRTDNRRLNGDFVISAYDDEELVGFGWVATD